MLFWTRIIREIIFGDNSATHLKSCSWDLRQLSFVEKTRFPMSCLGCCRVKWWLLFCGVGVVISATAGLPSPPPLSLLSRSVCRSLVVTQGVCPFPGPAVCLWTFCLVCTTSPCVSTTTSRSFPALNHWPSEHITSSIFFFQSWSSLLTFGKRACKMSLICCELERG